MLKSAVRYLLVFMLLFSVAGPELRAESYTFIIDKQEKKSKNRWSLEEWLETRDRMRLMDLWLALHSPSPYEFFIGGDYQFNQSDPGSRYNGWRLYGAAYASIFGLGIERESDVGMDASRWLGLFYLRIFGYHAQGTNITVHAGLTSESAAGVTSRNALAGVSLTIYIMKFFGIEGLYRHRFGSTPNTGGTSVSGDRFEGGAFIDFSFLRIYGSFFSAPVTTTSPGGETDVTSSGVAIGTRVFF